MHERSGTRIGPRTARPARASRVTSSRASGISLAVGSMSAVQLGYGLSEPLFDRIGAAGAVALRLALAALILWPFARPRLRGRTRIDLVATVALGACSGLLSLAFFEAIARIALGVAVTLQFLGPLGVALAGSRRLRDVVWVLVAGGGIALLTLGDAGRQPLDAVGVAFALFSALCWAGYIILTKRAGARWTGLEGLSVSLFVAALVALPPGIATAGRELLSPEILVVGIGLALLVLVPYTFELLALRRLTTALFGVIMSLEPAIAALLGFLILDQELEAAVIVAIAMVSVASAGATLSSREPSGIEEASPPPA